MSVPLLPLLAAAVVVEVVGVVVLVSGRRRSGAARGFVAGSAVAVAEVTDLRMRTPRYNRDMGDGWFCPVVRFALPDGRVVEAETMTGASPAPARPGDRVEVRYDPRDPSRVELAHGFARSGTLGCLHTGLGVALMLFGLLLLGGWFLLAVVVGVPG